MSHRASVCSWYIMQFCCAPCVWSCRSNTNGEDEMKALHVDDNESRRDWISVFPIA